MWVVGRKVQRLSKGHDYLKAIRVSLDVGSSKSSHCLWQGELKRVVYFKGHKGIMNVIRVSSELLQKTLKI